MGRKLISENLNTVIGILFKRLKLNFNAGVLKRLHEHPDFPSFLSIQHILKQEGVNSIAMSTKNGMHETSDLVGNLVEQTNRLGGVIVKLSAQAKLEPEPKIKN